MTVAYIISAYKLPHQLIRLVSRLQHPERSFYIHIDANAPPDVFAEAARALAAHANVHLLDRHACAWGDFGHVRATLKGLDALAASAQDAEYVVLLTGQDYPIKSNETMEAMLAGSRGCSYMNFRPLPVQGLERGGYERLPEPELPYGLRPFFGSGYWTLHREVVGYVRGFLQGHPAYVPYFERVRIPDEMFFQSILLNSPLAGTIVNDDQRLIKWPGPAILGSADWDDISVAPDLFARKFDETVDRSILDRIDRELLT